MAISIPSTDDAAPFFRAGAKTPDRRLTAGVFSFRLRPRLARASASLTDDEDSTSRYRRPAKKRGPLLSDGHERLQTMARKRNGWVPVGEVFGSLDGPVKAIHDTSPQARHHFTQADQVHQLVSAREADPDLGFMARLMALCCLPRTNPGNQLQYKRVNGPYTLVMSATGLHKLPFGNIPRLLMAWLCTEAVQTQSRELILGASLADFMRKLGIYHNSGGRGGVQTRLRNQMNRLFGCTVSLIYEDKSGFARVTSPVADKHEFWWNERKPGERVLWDSKIRLGEAFFNEIINHPVPLDMNTLNALKRSSVGLDLYLWLVYRTFSLNRPLRLSWRQLHRQFGVDPAKSSDKFIVRNFRCKVLRELKKIQIAWPELNYTVAKGVLILLPSTPSIPPGQQLSLVE